MVRIAEYCRSYHDVMDAAFLRDFPMVEKARAETLDDLPAALAGAEALIVTNSFYTPDAARTIREHGGGLRWIQFTTVGIDVGLASGLPDRVTVTNIGGVRQTVLSGHAIALMLGVMRGFQAFLPHRADRAWAREDILPRMTVPDGMTMVLVGMGRIGQDIARKARAFDMEVICVTRAAAPAVTWIDRVVPRTALCDVAGQADVLMIACPHDETTDRMVGPGVIAALKPSAIVVNVSRGAVTDEAALIAALKEGRIAGAGLDVFAEEPLPPESPFWDLPNVLMTPHMAGLGGEDPFLRLSELIRDNLRRFLAGEALENIAREPVG